MADNFNMKQYLTENKLGPYSKLKEDIGTQYQIKQTTKGRHILNPDKETYDLLKSKGSNDLLVKKSLANMLGNPNEKVYGAQALPDGSILVMEDETEEGYMGTQYGSSEDMAVDMVKKGITEKDKEDESFGGINEMDTEELAERLSPEAFGRMSSLSNFKAQQAMIKAAEIMMKELIDEGFEVDEIREYFNQLIANDI